MLNEIYNNQKVHNDKALEALKRDFTTLRTGKVSINILDHVHVDYYGSSTPLNQVATVLATDASTITITPWEKPMLKTIATAIQAANIGVNPNNDGESVKLFFPPMTTEDRQKKCQRGKGYGRKSKSSH
jgi:ribosome recycling factor